MFSITSTFCPEIAIFCSSKVNLTEKSPPVIQLLSVLNQTGTMSSEMFELKVNNCLSTVFKARFDPQTLSSAPLDLK